MHDAAAEGNRIIMIPVIARKDSQTERNNESGGKTHEISFPFRELGLQGLHDAFSSLKGAGMDEVQ